MFNDVVLIGSASKAEKKVTQNGLGILSFTMETTESYVKDGERINRSEFHRVVAFGTRAEEVLIVEGKLYYVNGRLHTRKYQDRDGVERYITEITASRIVDLSTPQVSEYPQQQAAPAQHARRPAPQHQEEPAWNTPPADISDMPF